MKTAPSLRGGVKTPLVSGLIAGCLGIFAFFAAGALFFLLPVLLLVAHESLPSFAVPIVGPLALGLQCASIPIAAVIGLRTFRRAKTVLVHREFPPPSALGVTVAVAVPLVCTGIVLLFVTIQAVLPRTEQYACRYNGASVVQSADNKRYELVKGTDVVLVLYRYEQGLAIVPDNDSDFYFYVQISPELVVEGQELAIPSTGVRPFLQQRWAYLSGIVSEPAQGQINILRMQDTTLEVWLEARAKYFLTGKDWKYEGEVKFETTFLPRACKRSSGLGGLFK